MKNSIRNCLIALFATSAFAGNAAAQSLTAPNVNAGIGANGNIVIQFVSAAGVEGLEFFIDLNPNTLATFGTVAFAVPNGGGACLVTPPARVSCSLTSPAPGTVLGDGTITVTFTTDAGATVGETAALEFSSVNFLDTGGVSVGSTANNGSLTIIGVPGPEVVVNPNGGAQTLAGSAAIGETNTFAFTASSTASAGDAGGADATIDCSLPAGSAFAITPAGVQTFTSGTGSLVNYSSTCVTVDGVVQNDTLTCSVTDQNGNRDVVFPLTCQAGVPIPGPTLALSPNGGALTLPPGIIGTTSSSSISVNVTDPGSAGGPSSTATCNTAAPLSLNGSPVTVAAGSSTGGTVRVSCPLTTVDQTGTVTCDIDGGTPIVFDVTCPAGSVAPPPATFVPASSLWSKLALFGIFAALGMLVLGLRRNH